MLGRCPAGLVDSCERTASGPKFQAESRLVHCNEVLNGQIRWYVVDVDSVAVGTELGERVRIAGLRNKSLTSSTLENARALRILISAPPGAMLSQIGQGTVSLQYWDVKRTSM
jgi:hypothetical protein